MKASRVKLVSVLVIAIILVSLISVFVIIPDFVQNGRNATLNVTDGFSSANYSLNTSITPSDNYHLQTQSSTTNITDSSGINSFITIITSGYLFNIGNKISGYYQIGLNVNFTGSFQNDVNPSNLSLSYNTNGTHKDTFYFMQLEYYYYHFPTSPRSVTHGTNVSADNPLDFGSYGYTHSSLHLHFLNRSAGIEPYQFSFSTQLQIILGIYPGSHHSMSLNLTTAGLDKPVSTVINIGLNQANITSK